MLVRHRRLPLAVTAALAASLLVAPSAGAWGGMPESVSKKPTTDQGREAITHCPDVSRSVVKCDHVPGYWTPGGGGSVSHKGWPKVSGILWQVVQNSNRGEQVEATRWADWLLGRHGSDTIRGGEGPDVIWGDSVPGPANNGRQKDLLDGGPGNDWIYASHGTNTILGGEGNDYISAYYGRGTVDCGPGRDTVRIIAKKRNRNRSKYKLSNCEKVTYTSKR
ncbi:calcium-binding protein [Patulibacter defluvii]|uniref:calcium-binding protein n=1 Tax=Patulibacter defluvii TaxID=3095358 RepID=UPI002A74BBB3|nr:calcium-binding protein [Patulibacter sp. DM4]